MTVHASVRTPVGMAALRDITPDDVERIVRYWHDGGADLLFLGVDPARLGTREDTRQRFLRAVRTGEPDQATLACAITTEDAFAGYTLLNRYAPEANYSHWHITESRFRAAGLSSALYPHRIKMYFDLAPITRLIHQTRTRNIGVNRMLDKYVPIAETQSIENPDGVAGPGEFHIRYVHAHQIPSFFETAAKLARQAP
jgi:hypothetical protein